MILHNVVIVKSLLYTICVLNGRTINYKSKIKIWNLAKEANIFGLFRMIRSKKKSTLINFLKSSRGLQQS